MKHTPLCIHMAAPPCACVDVSSWHHWMGSSCCRSHTGMASPLWITQRTASVLAKETSNSHTLNTTHSP